MREDIGLPKYRLGQLVLFKTRHVVDEHLDLGMIVHVNTMRGRVFGHYTYDIEWFSNNENQHRYIEEDTLDVWVNDYRDYRKSIGL